jgi:hypothetical protein
VDEWLQRLRPSGARGSNSVSIDAGGSPRQRRQRQQRRDAHRHDSLYEPLLMNAGVAADPAQPGANQRQLQERAVGRASEEDGDGDEEAEEQEHRAAVFRNSLFADAGEREWVCAICAFENRYGG